MHKRREGFTLIELLIVIVIIGILAAIAIPKFGATREKAYFKAMMSDLRNMSAQQEIYYSNNPDYEYTDDVTLLLGFEFSSGVELENISAGADGWGAEVSHRAIIDGRTCAVFHGEDTHQLGSAVTPGVVACNEVAP